ncbi:hypothetical protein AB1N83_009545 [Pleurotus pulmonarius]
MLPSTWLALGQVCAVSPRFPTCMSSRFVDIRGTDDEHVWACRDLGAQRAQAAFVPPALRALCAPFGEGFYDARLSGDAHLLCPAALGRAPYTACKMHRAPPPAGSGVCPWTPHSAYWWLLEDLPHRNYSERLSRGSGQPSKLHANRTITTPHRASEVLLGSGTADIRGGR